MSTYDALRDHLKHMIFREVELSFAEIERILGRSLPNSAVRPQWWANVTAPGHTQREAWRNRGLRCLSHLRFAASEVLSGSLIRGEDG